MIVALITLNLLLATEAVIFLIRLFKKLMRQMQFYGNEVAGRATQSGA